MTRLGTVARREALLAWLRERPEHEGLTAGEIRDVSGLYRHAGRSAARRDLLALEPLVGWLEDYRGGRTVRAWVVRHDVVALAARPPSSERSGDAR